MTEEDTLFLQKVKRCFACNIGYFIVGLVVLVASLVCIFNKPDFSWLIVIALITSISLILFSGITIARCISHINVERIAEQAKKTTEKN